ncbi:MAG: hypothetical protein HF973_18555 [Chloroflexi bacterium]|nr:hypothetical protein [Chloroflexota bacterium]
MQPRAKEPDRTRLTAVHKKNILVFLAFLGLAVLMTWPTLAKWNSEWAGGRSDLLVHQWTFWWIKEALSAGQNPFYTTLLYYPNGVSLLTHNIAWLNIAFWLPLQALIGEIAAYNVIFILIYALNGFAMYLFAAELMVQRPAAFIAGLIFAFWPYTLSHYDHPNLILTFAVPLALLYLYRTARQPTLRHTLLAALFLALIGFSRLQHLALAGLIIALFVVWLLIPIPAAHSRRSIKMLALAGGLSLLIMLPIITPLVYNQLTRSNPEDVAIIEPDDGRTDLAAYLVPSPDNTFWGDRIKPIYTPYAASWNYTPFIGYMTLILALLGLIFRWRQTWFWLLLAVIYILLALGPELAVNGQIYPDVPLPYNLIEGALLGDFIRRPHRLNVFLALPVAMMAGWGATVFSRQQRLKPVMITAVLAAIILIEYSALPFTTSPTEKIAWNEKLAAEPGDFAVLDIPAHNRSFDKWYMVYQMQHGKPIVGGHVSRMPREAFDFIKTVPILDSILQNDARADFSITNVAEQMRLLNRANVRYLVLHKRFANDGLQAMWRDWLTYAPTYEDEDVIVYRTAPQVGQDFAIEQSLTPEIGLIRADFAPSDAVQGGTIKVDARWGSTAQPGSTAVPGTAYNVCFWLVNGDWRLGIGDCQPVSESWPTDKWQVNEVLRGSYTLWLEEMIPPGDYQLQMALAEGEKVVGDTAVLGPITIHPFSPAHETNANWQNTITLRGYDLAQTDKTLQLALYWQGERPLNDSYKVFVHVINPATGDIAAQSDAIPRNWTYPTTAWEPGEIVRDVVEIPLAGVADGRYQIWIGLSHELTGDRLTVSDNAGQTDERLLLTTIDK